jgi:hypothetical protein
MTYFEEVFLAFDVATVAQEGKNSSIATFFHMFQVKVFREYASTDARFA